MNGSVEKFLLVPAVSQGSGGGGGGGGGGSASVAPPANPSHQKPLVSSQVDERIAQLSTRLKSSNTAAVNSDDHQLLQKLISYYVEDYLGNRSLYNEAIRNNVPCQFDTTLDADGRECPVRRESPPHGACPPKPSPYRRKSFQDVPRSWEVEETQVQSGDGQLVGGQPKRRRRPQKLPASEIKTPSEIVNAVKERMLAAANRDKKRWLSVYR